MSVLLRRYALHEIRYGFITGKMTHYRQLIVNDLTGERHRKPCWVESVGQWLIFEEATNVFV